LESADEEGEIPVGERNVSRERHQSSAGHEEPGAKQGGPPPKAEHYPVTDSEQYREETDEKNQLIQERRK